MAAPEDFEQFVAARQAALLRTAYLLTGNHHDAEDLVQTALVKAVPAWGRIHGDPEPYVRKILVRENISRWRRRRWREVNVRTLPEPQVHEDRTGKLAMAMAEALSALPPRQRAVVVLRYYEDLTERQTAEMLGISVGTVKSQAGDALRSLRRALADEPVIDARSH